MMDCSLFQYIHHRYHHFHQNQSTFFIYESLTWSSDSACVRQFSPFVFVLLFIKLSVFHFNYGSNFIFVFVFLTIPWVRQNKILTKVNFESMNKYILFFSVIQCCLGPLAVILVLNNFHLLFWRDLHFIQCKVWLC